MTTTRYTKPQLNYHLNRFGLGKIDHLNQQFHVQQPTEQYYQLIEDMDYSDTIMFTNRAELLYCYIDMYDPSYDSDVYPDTDSFQTFNDDLPW